MIIDFTREVVPSPVRYLMRTEVGIFITNTYYTTRGIPNSEDFIYEILGDFDKYLRLVTFIKRTYEFEKSIPNHSSGMHNWLQAFIDNINKQRGTEWIMDDVRFIKICSRSKIRVPDVKLNDNFVSTFNVTKNVYPVMTLGSDVTIFMFNINNADEHFDLSFLNRPIK